MALRNGSTKGILRFQGHNSTDNLENLAIEFWNSSINVIVNSLGSAEALRSPKAFNNAVSTTPNTNQVISLSDYPNTSEHRVLFDINLSTGSNVATYKVEDDFSNTQLRSGQSALPFQSIVVNNQLYRTNTNEFIQHTAPTSGFASWDVFGVGVAPPAAAPSISYVSGGTGAILVSMSVSYAYLNSRTQEVSNASPTSNILGASGANMKVRVPTVASTQHGVDKIVFFMTKDDGSERFNIVDSSGDPVTVSNATTNNDFDLGTLLYDTLTPETVYNDVLPISGAFMFTWKDRIFVTGFTPGGVIPYTNVAYSGLEAVYMGIPQSCFPPLNQFSAASRGEIMAGGIATQLGALLMSDYDSYLLEGEASDKTSGPEASTAVTEVLIPLGWSIGTKSPQTIRNTPFGTIWLDQALRLRLWNGQATPAEVGLPLRNELADIDLTALSTAIGQWYQFSEDGGVYMLTAKSASTGHYRAFFVSMYQDPASGNQMTGFAISDVQTQCLSPVYYNGVLTMFIGGVEKLFTFLLPTQSGSGWGSSVIYFEMVLGNENNYQYWHSLAFDGNIDLTKLTVTIRDVVKDVNENSVPDNISNARTLSPALGDEGDGTMYTLIDEYGRRKVLRFAFDATDADSAAAARKIKNVRVIYSNKKRLI